MTTTSHLPSGKPVEALPIVMDEVTPYATCRMCAVRVSRCVFPVIPLHAAGNPGAAASAADLPATDTQVAVPHCAGLSSAMTSAVGHRYYASYGWKDQAVGMQWHLQKYTLYGKI